MSPLDRQKLIIYSVIGVIAIGVLTFLWYRLIAPAIPEAPPEPPTSITGRIPEFPAPATVPEAATAVVEEEEKRGINLADRILLQLTEYAVISPSLNAKNDRILFYKKDGGNLISLDFNGTNEEKISNITIIGLQKAVWSSTRNRVAVFYLDDETRKGFVHFINGTSSVATLPSNIQSFSWDQGGGLMAYAVREGNTLNLVTAQANGGNRKIIFSTPLIDARIHWASSDKIIFETPPSSLAEGFSFTFSRSAGTFTKLAGPLYSFTSLWSPDGSKFFSSSSNRGGRNQLAAIRDSAGNIVLELPFLATIADKCVWQGNDTLWCAVPQVLPDGWPDAYLRGEVITEDRVMQIDAKTKIAQEAYGDIAFDMTNLIVSPDGQYLFFVNRPDGTLWRIKLK